MTNRARTPAFLRNDRIPPALRAALGEVLDEFPDDLIYDFEPSGALLAEMESVFDRGEAIWARAPELAELGHLLLDKRQPTELRRWGCIWLTQFPAVESIDTLARVALDSAEPKKLRSQAAWSLGFRQHQARHASLTWTPDALAKADHALLALIESTGDKIELEELGPALRHVDDPDVLAAISRRPLFWSEALEAFATPAIAESLLANLEDVPEKDAFRLLRLACATLGSDAAPRIGELAASAPLDVKLELLFADIAIRGETALGELERAIEGLRYVDMLRARARWHLANPGVFPTVRALRAARTTACLPHASRRDACARAADDLAALTAFARHPEAYLYAMWGHMVRGSEDPERARTLAEVHPDSTERVLPLLLRAYASRGRIGKTMQLAQQHAAVGRGAWELATHGRPFAALGLCVLSRDNDVVTAAARALGCFAAGRPDLCQRLLSGDPPRAEVLVDSLVTFEDATLKELPGFPGVDEKWWLENEPALRPELVAWQGGLPALAACSRGEPPETAEPDRVDFRLFEEIERRVRHSVDGRSVCLVGDFEDRARVEKILSTAGARLVDGPFAGVDFYYFESAPSSVVAKLERLGARLLDLDTIAKEAP